MGHKFVHIWHRVNEEARCSENKSTRLTLFASILKHCEVHWFGIKYKRQANQEYILVRTHFSPLFLFLKAITMCILSVPIFFLRWKWKSLEVEIKLAWNVNLCEYHEPPVLITLPYCSMEGFTSHCSSWPTYIIICSG